MMVQQNHFSIWPLAALAAVVLLGLMIANRRTRAAGVTIALVLVGMLFLGFIGMRASHQSVEKSAIVVQMSAAQAAQQHALAEAQTEVLKNQRLAVRMGDAVVQLSPDGTSLETYPDGMQIQQSVWSGKRTVVRPANELLLRNSSVQAPRVVSSRNAVKGWILFAPLSALLVAFIALRSRKPYGGHGVGWAIAGGLALLIGGLYMARTGSVMIEQTPVPPTLTIRQNAPEPPTAPLAEDYQEVVEEYPHDSAPNQESLEKLWARLTEPRIRLQNTVKKSAMASAAAAKAEQELAAAARLVLSASMPGADPFTQGWLVNAAKAIVEASAKAPRKHTAALAESKTLEGAEAAADAQSHGHIEDALPADIAHEHENDHEREQAGTPADSSDRSVSLTPIIRPVKMLTSPKDRPAWLDNPPALVGNTRRIVVSTDPYSTIEECYGQLQERLRQAVQERIAEKARDLNRGQSVFVPPLEWMGVTNDYILRELCPEGEYVEIVNASFGEMKRAHALLEFSEGQDEMLLDRWRAYARRSRVAGVAAASTLAVGALALVYGLLKVDTWTRGYYTKRLFLGVPAAIIGLFLLAVLIRS
jgi:hypothetical protein